MEHDVTKIGVTDWRDQNTAFGIRDADRMNHSYVIGKTGVGKSTLLLNMAISDMERGHGIGIIDPHGDLAETVLNYVPKERVNEVIYFNATDLEFPVAYNPLESHSLSEHHLIASELVSTFKKIWEDSWGPRLEYILRLSILTLLQFPGATLLHVQPLLSNASFRAMVLDYVKDDYLQSFWHNEYEKYSAHQRNEAIAPILNKVGVFASSKVLRNITGHPKSAFQTKEVINDEKIFIANLAKGSIGEDTSSILGSMLVNSFQLAALSRAEMDIEQRRPFYLYIDEMHNYVSSSVLGILSEARKYKLSLFFAHQYMDQLSEQVRTAIFGNVGTLIAFRVGAEDATYLSNEFHPVFKDADIINLPKYSICIKLMIDGVTSKAFSAKTLPLQPPIRSFKEIIVALTRRKFAHVQMPARKEFSHKVVSEKVGYPRLF